MTDASEARERVTRILGEGAWDFFGAAARAMQRVLVDHARRAKADKRGGGAARVTLSVVEFAVAGSSRG